MNFIYRATSLSTALGVALVLLAPSAQGATIGYWRFESAPDPNDPFPDNAFGNDFLVDSSGNGRTLINPTVTNPGFVNPAGDAGQGPNTAAPGFPNPVPQTGASNDFHAFTLDPDQYLYLPSEPAFSSGDFTIEALVRFSNSSLGSNADIATVWNGGANNAWRFLKNMGNNLALGLSGNGFGFATTAAAGFTFEAATDYYVAAVADITEDALVETTNVTFYIQNLTAGTPLQVIPNVVPGGANKPGPLNIANAEFQIGGAQATGDIGAVRIDEVRFSTGLLAEGDLLISPIPEPSAIALVLSACALAAARRKY